MDKQKLNAWIDKRKDEIKQKKDELYQTPKDQWNETDIKNHYYWTGAAAELVFLKRCLNELKAFD